jgi:3-carboxy-cis,cis-muconate cycloisomerase
MADVWSPASRVEAMLRFEGALAGILGRAGVVDPGSSAAIVAVCERGGFDVDSIERAALDDGNAAIPLVRALTAAVPEAARGAVHVGATSQDVLDTVTMLQARRGLRLLIEDLLDVGRACARLAERHASSPMAARTLLQQALPTTFGLVAARWLAAVSAGIVRLRGLDQGLPLQLGGAAGTLAAYGDRGDEVASLLGAELGLVVPELPWHTDRRPVAELASSLAITAGSMGKIAWDVALLMQSDVGEVREGRPGGSSSMPHKRNPVHAPVAMACTRLAAAATSVVTASMQSELERGVGGWQAEWAAVPDAFRATAGAVDRVRRIVEDLRVDPERMWANLTAPGSMVMAESLTVALAPRVGRDRAFALVERVVRSAVERGQSLRAAAGEEPGVTKHLTPDELDRATDPRAYLGSAPAMIRRAVESFRSAATAEPV